MIPTLRPLTYDDLLYLPDDGQRYEIIEGELIVSPAPSAGHQQVLRRLDRFIDSFVRQTNSGELFAAPFTVVLDRYDVVAPDLAFLAVSGPWLSRSDDSVEGVPDLVVEVISPTSRRTDRVRKMALYGRAGVPEYWIVDPERLTLEIFVLEGLVYAPVDRDAEGWLPSRVLSGLRVDPGTILSGPTSRLGAIMRCPQRPYQTTLQQNLG